MPFGITCIELRNSLIDGCVLSLRLWLLLPDIINRRIEVCHVVCGGFVAFRQFRRFATNSTYLSLINIFSFRNLFLCVAGKPKIITTYLYIIIVTYLYIIIISWRWSTSRDRTGAREGQATQHVKTKLYRCGKFSTTGRRQVPWHSSQEARLQEIERERAKARQDVGRPKSGEVKENFPQDNTGQSRDIAAKKLGMSGKSMVCISKF